MKKWRFGTLVMLLAITLVTVGAMQATARQGYLDKLGRFGGWYWSDNIDTADITQNDFDSCRVAVTIEDSSGKVGHGSSGDKWLGNLIYYERENKKGIIQISGLFRDAVLDTGGAVGDSIDPGFTFVVDGTGHLRPTTRADTTEDGFSEGLGMFLEDTEDTLHAVTDILINIFKD